MATVNFSVPDEVKKEFDRAFERQNKSAVIADLMRRAVTEVDSRKQRQKLFNSLTEGRARRPRATDRNIRAARVAGRP